MITDMERHQGVVLRKLITSAGRPVTVEALDVGGRLDSFAIEGSICHIKYSTKRLSPWLFSFTLEQLKEIAALACQTKSMWIVLVCGVDGVVTLRLEEFISVTEARPGGVASIRVSRNRGEMYRVSGNSGDLPLAKPRGVDQLIGEALQRKTAPHPLTPDAELGNLPQ